MNDDDAFIGEIRAFPYTFAPKGWALCNGQLLSITQNTALFSVIGLSFGGDGSSTFALPNLQGSVPVGQGKGAGLSNYVIGQSLGSDEVTLLEAHQKNTLDRHTYFTELLRLQGELVKLQDWVRYQGLKVVVLFEGRDSAGKGGAIKRITQRVNPRICRVVALPAPSDREKTQVYMQRYFAHFPAAGEVILFDRSWYNRAGVERVMGFCSDEQYERFMALIPTFERELVVHNNIILRKYFLDVSKDEQRRRFEARISDPVKHWKLSPMDTESVRRWWDYTAVYQRMIEATHTPEAPWHIVPADDKRRARLNLIRHLLDSIPYKKVDIELPKIPKVQRRPKDATEGVSAGQVIPSHY